MLPGFRCCRRSTTRSSSQNQRQGPPLDLWRRIASRPSHDRFCVRYELPGRSNAFYKNFLTMTVRVEYFHSMQLTPPESSPPAPAAITPTRAFGPIAPIAPIAADAAHRYRWLHGSEYHDTDDWRFSCPQCSDLRNRSIDDAVYRLYEGEPYATVRTSVGPNAVTAFFRYHLALID